MTTPRDKNGYPIKHGDLVRTPHFRGGPHRRQYYLYHIVRVRPDGFLEAFPYPDTVRPHDGGTWNVTEESATVCEIVANIGTELWDERK